jgi:hypothetical protein
MQFSEIAQNIRELRDSIESHEGVAKSETSRLLDRALNIVIAAKEHRAMTVDWTQVECVWGSCKRCSKCNGG